MEERTFDTLEEAQNFLKTRELSGPEAFGREVGALEPVPGAAERSQLALGPGSLIGSAVLGLLGFKPPVTKVIGSIANRVGTGARGLLTQAGTQANRVAGVAGFLGREAAPEARLALGQSAIKDAFRAAEGVEGSVPVGNALNVVRAARGQVMDEDAAQKLFETQALLGEHGGTVPYRDLVKMSQSLPTTDFDNSTNAVMRNVRQSLIDASRPVSPALAQANAMTANFHSSEELINAVVGKNSRTAINAVDRILSKWGQQEPFRLGAVGLDDPQRMAQFRSLVASGAGAEKLQGFLRLAGRASLYAGAGAAGYGTVRHFFPGGGGY